MIFYEVHHVRRLELRKHAVEFVAVADVDLLELEPVGFRDRRQILQISCVGKFVDHADGVRRVVDDMPGHCRPDESGSAGDDDAVHDLKCLKTGTLCDLTEMSDEDIKHYSFCLPSLNEIVFPSNWT